MRVAFDAAMPGWFEDAMAENSEDHWLPVPLSEDIENTELSSSTNGDAGASGSADVTIQIRG